LVRDSDSGVRVADRDVAAAQARRVAGCRRRTRGSDGLDVSANAVAAPPKTASPKKAVILLAVIGTCGLFLFVLFAGFGNDPHAVPFGMAGKPAPLFTMKDLATGETVALKDFIGRPIVLNFWATWCGPCKMEHPYLEWAHRKYSPQGVVFLGVVFEDSEENVRAFIAENGGTFRQLFDPKSTVAVDYAAAGVPETYFIDKKGVIVTKYALGPMNPPLLDENIAKILK
jgi:cytochrome c biogenesis protein CcmG/thiol:disulfide interchange protein DsbE